MEADNSVYSTVNFCLKANELEKEASKTQKEGCFAAFPWIHMKNVTDAHTHTHTQMEYVVAAMVQKQHKM